MKRYRGGGRDIVNTRYRGRGRDIAYVRDRVEGEIEVE